MARLGNNSKTTNQPRRRSLWYRDPESDGPIDDRDMELDTFLEHARINLIKLFDALTNGTWELRDEIKALTDENKALKDRVKDKDTAL